MNTKFTFIHTKLYVLDRVAFVGSDINIDFERLDGL